MLQLSTSNYKVYDLRARINPSHMIPYFTRLSFTKKLAYVYKHVYTFEKTHSVVTNIKSTIPLVPNSPIERNFVGLIYNYMELDDTIQPNQEIYVTPTRINITPDMIGDVSPYISELHSGLICISRENVTGGIYTTTEFARQLLPMELYIGKKPTISVLDIENPSKMEGHMDIIFFSKKDEEK